MTVYVFDTPDFLADEQVSWRIVKREKSVRLPDYESCSVITDSRGLPLFFFRCTSTVNDRFSTHPTNSYFSAQLLSQLKWEVQCASEPAIGRLTVDRFSIYVENGYLTVRKEILYRTDGSEIADPNNLTADVLPEKWSPALQGLRARLACTGQFDCRGHYHKNPPK